MAHFASSFVLDIGILYYCARFKDARLPPDWSVTNSRARSRYPTNSYQHEGGGAEYVIFFLALGESLETATYIFRQAWINHISPSWKKACLDDTQIHQCTGQVVSESQTLKFAQQMQKLNALCIYGVTNENNTSSVNLVVATSTTTLNSITRITASS